MRLQEVLLLCDCNCFESHLSFADLTPTKYKKSFERTLPSVIDPHKLFYLISFFNFIFPSSLSLCFRFMFFYSGPVRIRRPEDLIWPTRFALTLSKSLPLFFFSFSQYDRYPMVYHIRPWTCTRLWHTRLFASFLSFFFFLLFFIFHFIRIYLFIFIIFKSFFFFFLFFSGDRWMEDRRKYKVLRCTHSKRYVLPSCPVCFSVFILIRLFRHMQITNATL